MQKDHRAWGTLTVRSLLLALALLATAAVGPAAALAVPSATTNPASKVHHTSAVLNGHLDPDADPGITACSFEWGTTVAYGTTAPCNEGNAFASPANVSANLGNLTPGTTYHYRFHIETTSSGPFNGADRSFRPDTFPTTRGEIASFGPDGTPASSFGKIRGVAFNQTSRELFVIDGLAGAIFGFGASSPPSYSPLPAFDPLSLAVSPGERPAIAVDGTALASAGNTYYASYNPSSNYRVYGYDSSGTPLPGFPVSTAEGEACGLAVDSAGHLWVTDHRHTVEEFSSAGVKIGSVDLGSGHPPVCALAFDTNDDLYLSLENGPDSPAWKYTAASGYTSGTEFAPGPNDSIAVDPSTHNVYFGRYAEPSTGRFPSGARVDEYDSAGHFLGEFASLESSAQSGGHVAVDPVTHNVFVDSADDKKIHVFGGPETTIKLPTVTTGSASAITGSSATISGAVDPEGLPVTECRIKWGIGYAVQTVAYEHEAPCNPGSGSGDVAFSVEISGLQSGTSYHYRVFASNADGTNAGKDLAFVTKFSPTASPSAPTSVSNNSADLNGLVNPKGFATSYRFEWGTTRAYGNSVPVPGGSAGSGESNVAVAEHLSGLAPNTRYHWRLVAENVNGGVTTSDNSFVTLGAPVAETVGAPVHTMTSAQLGGRVSPRGFATTYYFEYGDQGPCDSNPCTQTDPRPAGAGEFISLVSEEVEGLEPNTTYHYRIVADNGQPGSPVSGDDMTVTTRSGEPSLSHGLFPGPPGSDRAWELVSSPEAGGNPAGELGMISDNGDRVVWELAGGSPISETGGFNQFYSERTATGWQTQKIYPSRDQLAGPNWRPPMGPSDLSTFTVVNFTASGAYALFRVTPGAPPVQLFRLASESERRSFEATSDDGSRVLFATGTSADPDYPTPLATANIFDVTTGSPHLVSLLPGNTVSPCDVPLAGTGGAYAMGVVSRAKHWISNDGSLAFFMMPPGSNCGARPQVFVRDFGAAETKLLSGPVLSGPDCGAGFIRSTPGAAFFWTRNRLTAADTEPDNCSDESDGDIYRYDLGDDSLKCVTCVVPDTDADVFVGGSDSALSIVVAEDESRLYFSSAGRLLPGARSQGVYRLDLENGDLAYLGAFGPEAIGTDRAAVTPDGSIVFFTSSDPSLNPLGGGAGNVGTEQFYRYDDSDRSLVCVSCPRDGSAPRAAVIAPLREARSPNGTPMSEDGVFAFSTPTPLAAADQNTAGPGQDPGRGSDVYEWRDGRLLLVTDGLTDWPGSLSAPLVRGVTPSGRDILFTAATRYTADAMDDFSRLYDARIGGGFNFPKPPSPCPLEVCQGTPKGAPEEQAPGTGSFAGPGNQAAQRKPSRCAAGQRKVRRAGKTRCLKPRHSSKHKRANHNRRAAR